MFDAERRVYAASIYIYTHLYLHASRSMNFTIISTNASFLTWHGQRKKYCLVTQFGVVGGVGVYWKSSSALDVPTLKSRSLFSGG